MYYTFPAIPSLLNNVQVSKLPDQTKLTQQEKAKLEEIDGLRASFKQITEPSLMKQCVTGQYSFLPHQKTLEAYLKTNVDMMRILVIKHQGHPEFGYDIFLSNKTTPFDTKHNSIEEACGCEIVMARYIYAMGFLLSANQHAVRVKQAMLTNFSNQNTQALQQSTADINAGLQLLEFAQGPLHRLCNCMEDLLKSLVTKQDSLIPELKMTVLVSFKNILDSNANFLLLEKLRQLKDFEKMARVCRTTYSKLNETFQRLSQIEQEVNPGIVQFCQQAMTFYRAYGIWCILQVNEKAIRYEEFKVKGYNVLTSENFKIAHEIQRVVTSLSQQQRKEFEEFTFLFVGQCLLNSVQKILTIYEKGAQVTVKNPDELFMGLDSSFDFYEARQQNLI